MTLRRALAVVLCLLLLSLQQQALVHPLAHLAGKAERQDVGFSTSKADAPCTECALLASGGASPVGWVATPHYDGTSIAVLVRPFLVRAESAPAWFRSRAPPLLV